ncbi:MAG TPA: flagellar basal body-associated FliL family protein [bacterium]|nr:flagellar basal body-associated FliL family protein [bacterium]
MAGEPRTEEPKKKLSFFRKAKPAPDAEGSGTAVATATAPEADEAPTTTAAEEAALEAWAQAGVEGESAKGAGEAPAGSAPAEATAENKEVQAQPDAAPTPKRSRFKVHIPRTLAPGLGLAARALVILAIIVVDACAAFLVVRAIAPKLVASRAKQAVASVGTAAQPQPATESKAPAGQPTAMGTINQISDLVVNPAGTDGTRYLCTTVALETIDPKVSEEIKNREAQIRDVLIEILGRRTIDELADLGTRDALREEIRTGVNKLLTGGEVVGVYFSNFVLQ